MALSGILIVADLPDEHASLSDDAQIEGSRGQGHGTPSPGVKALRMTPSRESEAFDGDRDTPARSPTDPDGLAPIADRFIRHSNTALVIVTAAALPDDVVGTVEYERSGCVVGFVTQASIDPWRLLVCLSPANHTFGVAARASHLAVHLIPHDRFDLARLFGELTGDDVDKFTRCKWHWGPAQTLILDEAPVMVGRLVGRFEFGDHVGHLLDPVAVGGPDPTHAVLHLGDVDRLEPGHPRRAQG
jgi:flavin reductase (DIM6/NTAB) family NADH-FMN oxidoreductase RutF